MRELRSILSLGLISASLSATGHAFVVPSSDLSSRIPRASADTFVQTLGFSLDHRPYRAASSLSGLLGFGFGIEATLVQTPETLNDAILDLKGSYALVNVNVQSGNIRSDLPVIPNARLHLRKSLGERFEVGASLLGAPSRVPSVGGSWVLGLDVKWVIWKAEEGPVLALRASWNETHLNWRSSAFQLSSQIRTLTPAFLLSKPFSFAEPYLGMAYQTASGSLQGQLPVPTIPLLPGIALAPLTFKLEGSAQSAAFFGGLCLDPGIGLRWTLEGTYQLKGQNAIGTQLAFYF